MLDFQKVCLEAYQRINPHIRETILEKSVYYSQQCKANVFLKMENLQHTRSFKVRGAMNKVLTLTSDQLNSGAVSASTGNHGVAIAYSLSHVGAKGIVFVPKQTNPTKAEAIKRYNSDVYFAGTDSVESENAARKYAEENGLVFIPPYNDPLVIAGQGTIGVELANQLEKVEAVFVSVGGGGLISGIGGYLKAINPNIKIIGCSPENSQVMIQSIRMGKLVGNLPSQPTLSQGTAGGVEDGSITFEICQTVVDEWITVTEEEIRNTLLQFMETHLLLIEGAAAVAIAAFLKAKKEYVGKNVVIILCGANIGIDTIREIL